MRHMPPPIRRPNISISTQKNQADVGKSVRDLLISTKRLQDLLEQWSRGQANEMHVSDVFVEVGTNFNSTIRAFAYYHIDLSDIHSVPQELRQVLEQCLGEDPSPEVLDNYMPEVKRVLYKLLKGLQARGEAWKATSGRLCHDGR